MCLYRQRYLIPTCWNWGKILADDLNHNPYLLSKAPDPPPHTLNVSLFATFVDHYINERSRICSLSVCNTIFLWTEWRRTECIVPNYIRAFLQFALVTDQIQCELSNSLSTSCVAFTQNDIVHLRRSRCNLPHVLEIDHMSPTGHRVENRGGHRGLYLFGDWSSLRHAILSGCTSASC